jgi:hypothetical protein
VKNLKSYDEFLNESVNSLPISIQEIEKALPKVIDLNYFLKQWYKYASVYNKTYDDMILEICPSFKLQDLIISSGQYAAYKRETYNGGYGGIKSLEEGKRKSC